MKFSSEPSFPLVCLMSDDGCLLDEDVQKGGTKFLVWMKSLNSARSGQSSNNSLKNYWTLFLCDARCLYHTANENVQFTGLHNYKYGKWSRVASTRNSDTWRWTQFKASSAITISSTQHVLRSLLNACAHTSWSATKEAIFSTELMVTKRRDIKIRK